VSGIGWGAAGTATAAPSWNSSSVNGERGADDGDVPPYAFVQLSTPWWLADTLLRDARALATGRRARDRRDATCRARTSAWGVETARDMRHGVRVRPAEWPGWCRGARQKTPDFRDSGAQVPSCPGCQRKKTRLFGVTETHTSADELFWYSIFALLSWVFACAHYPSREINDRKLRARKFGAMSLVEISTGDASRGFRSRRSVDAHSRSRFTTPTRFAKLQVRTRPDPPTYPFRIHPLHRPSFNQNAVPASS
jgi:hypothetical protein